METKFEFVNKEGKLLKGILTDAKENCPRHLINKLIIFVHGLCSGKNSRVLVELCHFLPFPTIRFDLSGCGESEGVCWYSSYGQDYSDLLSLIEYLTSNFKFEIKALVGHSKGSCCVFNYVLENQTSNYLIVNIAGRFNFENCPPQRFSNEQLNELKEKGKFVWTIENFQIVVTEKDFKERIAMGLKLKKNLKSIRNKVLTIHGKNDSVVPVEDAYCFNEEIPSHTLRIIEEANHSFSKPIVMKELCKIVYDWLIEN